MLDENAEVDKEQLREGPVFHSRRFKLCPMGKGRSLKHSQKQADSQIFPFVGITLAIIRRAKNE